jgi:hypothetical protein
MRRVQGLFGPPSGGTACNGLTVVSHFSEDFVPSPLWPPPSVFHSVGHRTQLVEGQAGAFQQDVGRSKVFTMSSVEQFNDSWCQDTFHFYKSVHGERGLLTECRYSSRRIVLSTMPTLMPQGAKLESGDSLRFRCIRVVSKSYLEVSHEDVPRVSVEEHSDLAGRSCLDHSAT